MATELVETHRGEVPRTMEALVKLPGVGRKTANVVLGHALGVPGLPVDRHVLRVANRIGIAKSDDPEVVEQQLCGGHACRGVDAHVRHADSARPPHLQAAPAVRSVRHPGRLRLLYAPDALGEPPASTVVEDAGKGVTRERFTELVEDALREIPRRFRNAMKNVAVVVEDQPSAETLAEMEVGPDDTLFGLYQGTPLPERSWGYGNTLPDRISIYQIPIEEACEDDDEIRDCVAETVIHEFGHYFGMSEEEIEEIEEKYWRGESLDDV